MICLLLALASPQLPTSPQVLENFAGTPVAAFGIDVALGGDHAAVATSAQPFMASPGSVLTFERTASGPWQPDVEIDFQASTTGAVITGIFELAMSSTGQRPTLVIGAPGTRDTAGGPDRGAVYIYERVAGAWSLAQTIYGDPLERMFGADVAVDGDTLLIGQASSTYVVFEYARTTSSGGWLPVETFTPPGLIGSNGQDAPALALSGDLAVVGTPLDSQTVNAGGAAQVFRRSGSGSPWAFEARLEGPVAYFYGQQGHDVDVDIDALGNERIVVGSGVGEAYVFASTGTGDWEMEARLTPYDGRPAGFGLEVHLDGHRIALGARGRHGAEPGSGAALTYIRREDAAGTSTWEAETLLHPGLGPGASGPLGQAGVAIALDGDTVFSGAPDNTPSADVGVVYSYELGNRIGVAHCRGELNSTGSYSTIAAYGSVLASQANVGFDVIALPPGSMGFPLTSLSRAQLPGLGGGEGNLCLGGSIARLSLFQAVADASGEVSVQLDFANLPALVQLLPGTTWSFQWWHRDTSPTGPSSNTSDAVEIAFE